MADMPKPPDPLPEAVRRWSQTPSPNPRYRSAKPADVACTLMRYRNPKVRTVLVGRWAKQDQHNLPAEQSDDLASFKPDV